MLIEGDSKLWTSIVDKQFEMLGVNIKFANIPDSGLVQSGKKMDYWYNVYKFTEEQEQKWKEWAIVELKKLDYEEEKVKDILMYLELRYGLVIRYTKKGELF